MLLLALLVAGAYPAARAPQAGADERYRIRRERVAPGLVLLRIYDRQGPNRIRALKVDKARELTLDTVLANERIPGHETTSSMARREGAIAAVNGDYTLLPADPGAGRPVHTFASDVELVTSPLVWGRNFALSNDEEATYIGHPQTTVTALQHDSGTIWKIKHWNEQVAPSGEFSGYTTKGGTLFRPPEDACSMRLFPSGTPAWNEDGTGIQQDMVVDAVRCSPRRMARRHSGIVVTTPSGSRQSTAMSQNVFAGETFTLTWSTGWEGVVETIGGNPTLLEDGAITTEDCDTSYFCDPNPRTGVGVNAAGKILLVTVDGRQPKKSVGMTPVEFAELFQYLGATWALNLDGGGSTAMWVDGGLVNEPSGGHERAVGSALIVLPGPDAEEVPPAPYPGPAPLPSPSISPSPGISPTPSVSPSAIVDELVHLAPSGFERTQPLLGATASPRCAALFDPASTGGLLDALASGAVDGRKHPLPRILERALGVYDGRLTCAEFLRARPRS